MTKTYQSIKKEIAELERRAEELRKKEVAGVVLRIKEAIASYGLSARDLGLGGASTATAIPTPRSKSPTAPSNAVPKPRAPSNRPPKYHDAAGNVWGGRGPRPRWLRDALASGKKLEDFAAR